MPIITPAYPAINSTFNVSESTLHMLREEFARGTAITLEIEQNQNTWDALFEPADFFQNRKFVRYVQIETWAPGEKELRAWFASHIQSSLTHHLTPTPTHTHSRRSDLRPTIVVELISSRARACGLVAM